MKILTVICDGSFLIAFACFASLALVRLHKAGAFDGLKRIVKAAFFKKFTVYRHEDGARKIDGGMKTEFESENARNDTAAKIGKVQKGKILRIIGGVSLTVSVATFCFLKSVFYA